MSSTPINGRGHDELAAEYALGLLEGEDLAQAIELVRTDLAFRSAVDRWSSHFAPLFDSVPPVEPPLRTFEAIERQIGPTARSANDNAVDLRQQLSRWRLLAGGSTALAASLALILMLQPAVETPPPTSISSPPMVAMIEGDQGAARLVATWSERDRSLTVIPATVPAANAGHAHELWMIPADGKPRSMGVMPDGPMHATVEPAMAEMLAEGVVLAVSLEPAGGSPTGAPTGPVLASGKLQRA
jgi:anti-sigma-K factor RskA